MVLAHGRSACPAPSFLKLTLSSEACTLVHSAAAASHPFVWLPVYN